MVMSDLGVDGTPGKVELRFATGTSGEQYVMTYGQALMVLWSADSSDFHHTVHIIIR